MSAGELHANGKAFPAFCALGREVRGVPVVGVFGEVDGAVADDLRLAIDRASTRMLATDRVVLDLRGVEFIDSEGLKVLIDATHRLQSIGAELRLVVEEEGRLLRSLDLSFELAGIVWLPSIYHDLQQATSMADGGNCSQ